MSDEMASESEIAAAAERVKLLAEQGKDDPDFLLDSIVPFCDDAEFVASHVLACLAADRAEREERARPIDAEWLRSIGFVASAVNHFVLREPRLGVWLYGPEKMWVARIDSILRVLRNRGDLLDLLRVLKGGA